MLFIYYLEYNAIYVLSSIQCYLCIIFNSIIFNTMLFMYYLPQYYLQYNVIYGCRRMIYYLQYQSPVLKENIVASV